MDGHSHIGGFGVELLFQGVCQGEREEIRRGGLDADLRDHDGPGGFGRVFVFLDHGGDVGDFAGDVEVVGAILGAGFEGVLAVGGVGTDGGDENEGLLGEGGEVGVVEGTGFYGGGCAVWVELFELFGEELKFGLGAAGDGPFKGAGEVSGDVLCGEFAGVAWVSVSL